MSNGSPHLPKAHRTGISLALSGGGFRATLFHLGALRRLNEFGVLSKVERFSSVSGGSILNGVLATRWNGLEPAAGGVFSNLESEIVAPIEEFCRADLRTEVLFWSRTNPLNWWRNLGRDHSVTDRLTEAYARDPLRLKIALADVRPKARFIFCSTNLETGRNWEFEIGPDPHVQMGDYRTGHVHPGSTSVAQAVAASSAFPPGFPPLVLEPDNPAAFQNPQVPLSALETISLTDGGVYDNLGLEPVWKDTKTLLVSDAGAPFSFKDDPPHDIVHRLKRCFDVSDDQSRALRKRWLIASFIKGIMDGTYWGIATNFRDYELSDARGYEGPVLDALESVRTDLDSFSEGEIGCLENHGYALADAALRRHVGGLVPSPAPAFQWPSPDFSPGKDAAWEAIRDSRERGILRDVWRSAASRIGDLFDRD